MRAKVGCFMGAPEATPRFYRHRRRPPTPSARASLSGVRVGPASRLGTPVTAFLVIVAVASGVTGVAVLAVPGSTGRYFSWALRPAGAAALIGGFYVASAIVFAWALTLPWSQVHPLVVGVFGLALPTLALTAVHDEVFDFGRWQAVAWVLLFLFAPVFAAVLLATHPPDPGSDRRLHPATRAVPALLALALLVAAVLVWVDGSRDDVERWAPVPLVRLTGTYLGAWCSFLGVLCGVAAVRDRWDAARVPLAVLGLAAGGVLVGLLRTASDLDHAPAAFAVAATVLVVAAGLYTAERPAG
jgi:hypothetical protein